MLSFLQAVGPRKTVLCSLAGTADQSPSLGSGNSLFEFSSSASTVVLDSEMRQDRLEP